MSVVRKTPKFAEQQKAQHWNIPIDMDSDASDDKENSQGSFNPSKNPTPKQHKGKDINPKDQRNDSTEKTRYTKSSRTSKGSKYDFDILDDQDDPSLMQYVLSLYY